MHLGLDRREAHRHRGLIDEVPKIEVALGVWMRGPVGDNVEAAQGG